MTDKTDMKPTDPNTTRNPPASAPMKPDAKPGMFHSGVTIPDDWATLSVADTVALAKKIQPEGAGNAVEIIKAEVARRAEVKGAA